MFKRLLSALNKDIGKKEEKEKQTISEKIIEIHNQNFGELKVLAPIMKALDTPQLQEPSFLSYIKLRSSLAEGSNEYEGLGNSAELLRVAILTKSSFLKIEQTELRYRGLKQQAFYDYIFQLLEENFGGKDQQKQEDDLSQYAIKKTKADAENKYSSEEFKAKINDKLEEILPTIKSEEGQAALKEYRDSLAILAQDNSIGLKLLYTFKKFQLADFSTLSIISDMVEYLQDKPLNNLRAFIDLVNKNMEVFNQIANIIYIPKTKQTADNFAILLQYTALSRKYQSSYGQLGRLIEVLKQWYPFYENVKNTRKNYPESDFILPAEFQKEIPGVEIYDKYQDYLKIKI